MQSFYFHNLFIFVILVIFGIKKSIQGECLQHPHVCRVVWTMTKKQLFGNILIYCFVCGPH